MVAHSPSYSYAFFDPFAQINLKEDDEGLSASHPPVPPAHQVDGARPQSIRISTGLPGSIPLPIQGQGTVAISADGALQLVVVLSTVEDERDCFYFVVSEKECYFSIGKDHYTGLKIESRVTKSNPNAQNIETITYARYLRPNTTDRYWLSLDRKNGIVRYGKKYLNAGLTLYETTLKKLSSHGVHEWIDQRYAFLDHVSHVQVLQTGGNLGALRVAVQPLPIVTDLPPFVISNQLITLDHLAKGFYTVPENLPVECQKLYHNVAGPNIKLDSEDFPDFSAAIQRSVNTPGLIGHTLLKAKATEFGRENFKGTYLRITLGHDQGNSPGPPYVLEIWPAGHYSPIHDHGNSFAIIRVLHGKISTYFYDSLGLPPRVLGPPARLKKEDITWISDKNYQVHQLYNESNDGTVCCTIQCYQYGQGDKKHDEFFEYLADVDGDRIPDKKDEFKPNSDYEFHNFKRDIKKEWEQRDEKSL